MKQILQNIFSIKNEFTNSQRRKVITILGLKIKIKSSKVYSIFLKNNRSIIILGIPIYKEELDESHIVRRFLFLKFKSQIKTNLTFFKTFKSAVDNIDKLKYKNNVLLFKYYYKNIKGICGVNLGDYVQTIATQNALKNTIIKNANKLYVDRDDLSLYNGDYCTTIMQGWFSHSSTYLPNEKILPVFIGTHITTDKRQEFIELTTINSDYFKNLTIGCRDMSTLKFLQTNNIKSYLSRCLTLTIPRRESTNKQNKIFIVDIPKKYLKYIPNNITNDAEYINQRAVDADLDSTMYFDDKKYFSKTQNLLNKYKSEAKLVITSALHCASPCIAMGIPTILIDFEKKNDRFSSLDGILRIYSAKDLKNNKIDYNPTVLDIEELKQLMLKNVDLSLKEALGEKVNIDELSIIRRKIEEYKI